MCHSGELFWFAFRGVPIYQLAGLIRLDGKPCDLACHREDSRGCRDALLGRLRCLVDQRLQRSDSGSNVIPQPP